LSKCTVEVKSVVEGVTKSLPGIGKFVSDYFSTNLQRIVTQGDNVRAAERVNTAVDIATEEAVKRFTKQGDLPEQFTRSGNIEIKAAKGKIGKREAQQVDIMNQFGMANIYSRIAAIPRNYFKDGKVLVGGKGINLFIRQIDLADAHLRAAGIPLTTVKPDILNGSVHYSNLTFGDIGKVFAQLNKANEFGSYVLRSPKATENIQNQNIAEAVRRIIEHGDIYGKIDLDGDLELLRPQIVDALKNPSGLGRPKKGTKAGEGYDAAIKWSNSAEGSKLIDELADELLSEDTLTALIKANEEMRIINMTLSKGDGLRMADSVLKMITGLSNPNDRIYAYGDFLLNDRFKKIFEEDALVKMTPEELNLAFGQNFIAQFFNGVKDESIVIVTAQARRAKAANADKAATKKTGKPTMAESNKARAAETAENAAAAAAKAADEVKSDPNVRVQEPSLEAAELARRYQLEFEVGPLLGGVTRAFNWLSDKATMGGRMKTSLIGTEHFRLENAATMSGQLGKFFNQYGRNADLFNKTFISLQKIDLSRNLDESLKGMSEEQKAIAAPMAEFIQQIFGAGSRNNLDMNGIFGREMEKSMKAIGLGKYVDQISASSGYSNDAWGEWWKTLVLEPGDNVINVMGKVYAAMQLSKIKPTMASSLRHHFSHTADGLTREQAIKAGYRPIADNTPLGEYLKTGDKPPLFHPDIINKMAGVNAHLEYERAFDGKWQKFWNNADTTIGVLKSSITIWRPGHHMVSFVGNTLFNTAAGVRASDYVMAVKMIAKRGDVLDIDETVLTNAIRAGAPDGYKVKESNETISVLIGGKKQEVPLEVILRMADEIAGVPISPRRAKDIPDDNNVNRFGVDGIVQKFAPFRGIAAADHQIAKVAAVRDNLARYALFVRELKRGTFRDLEDAALQAGQIVHEFHPTVGTLSAGEKKYARRMFFFYTWQKQALFKIMELAANQPQWITMPSKLQYAIATANGMNPESFGDGWDPEGLYASYFTNSIFAPQMRDDDLGAVGIRPASPQLDVIDAYFSQIALQPGRGFWEGMGEMMAGAGTDIFAKNASPLFRVPTELATGNRIGGMGKIDNVAEYLVDNTGLGSLSRMSGFTPWGEQRSDFKDGEYGEKDRERQAWNWLFGAKTTYYESPASLERARQEQVDYWARVYKTGKYAEDK
jgi:hypothetical protein